jgi:hypothetical protein
MKKNFTKAKLLSIMNRLFSGSLTYSLASLSLVHKIGPEHKVGMELSVCSISFQTVRGYLSKRNVKE